MNPKKTLFALLFAAGLHTAAGQTPLYENKAFVLYPDRVAQGLFNGTAEAPDRIVSNFASPHTKDDGMNYAWKCKNDLSAYPRYESEFPIEVAVYNLGLDEMVNAVERNLTLRTGAQWGGIWTRDVSYSILLAMAYMQPTAARNSLLRKIDDLGRVVQDTGTGGSWPCSSDRMIWAAAAWEIYKTTGDRDWLRTVYEPIRRSAETDRRVVFDERTGLYRGESSFIDWREQSYPAWMQPADIYESKCLGTNAVHYRTLDILGKMARTLGKPADAERYAAQAAQLKTAINDRLWIEERGYYAQYLYGRRGELRSPRSETLGEALAILFGIASAEQSRLIVNRMPLTNFGPTVFYPQIPDQYAYHNDAVWPFVTSFWMLAASKAGNEEAVKHAAASTYRAALLFATNKENFRAHDGDWAYTKVNSSNMLWSLSGNLSIVFRLYFGMRFEEEALRFDPFVPRSMACRRTLSDFPYQKATLTLELEGYGGRIRSFTLDGKSCPPVIPATLSGRHHVRIVLDNSFSQSDAGINLTAQRNSLATPRAELDGSRLHWQPVEGAVSYTVLRNYKPYKTVAETELTLDDKESGEYQVMADAAVPLLSSFASEPVVWGARDKWEQSFIPVRLDEKQRSGYRTQTSVPIDGIYAIDWEYANGNGGVTNRNMCAIRSLYVDGQRAGTVVLPQRGKEEWENFGWSNPVQLRLTPGNHTVELRYETGDRNMNIETNSAVIRTLRFMRIEE